MEEEDQDEKEEEKEEEEKEEDQDQPEVQLEPVPSLERHDVVMMSGRRFTESSSPGVRLCQTCCAPLPCYHDRTCGPPACVSPDFTCWLHMHYLSLRPV